MGRTQTQEPSPAPYDEAFLAEIDKLIDAKLDQPLGEFERRLLEQVRPIDRPENRQPPPEELIEDRQVSEEVRPETRPDYQAVRDRILRSLTTGRGRIAPSAPQYKTATKVLDSFIAALTINSHAPSTSPNQSGLLLPHSLNTF